MLLEKCKQNKQKIYKCTTCYNIKQVQSLYINISVYIQRRFQRGFNSHKTDHFFLTVNEIHCLPRKGFGILFEAHIEKACT